MKSLCVSFMVMLCMFASGSSKAEESVCYGTTGNGRLAGGVKLPAKGPNFVAYSRVAGWLGRTYVHSKVRDVILDAYRLLETELPSTIYKYAETGFKEGGKFKPHKTHQNGLSVDFTVPVTDVHGNSVQMQTNAFNKYGYSNEFDAEGKFEDYRIDFEALGAHIVALHKAALQHGIGVWRVIFDPQLQPKLFATSYGSYIKQHITIPNKKSWVRHDDHYHVDFSIECQPLEQVK